MKNQLLLIWLLFLTSTPFLSGCTVETAHAPVENIEETATAAPTATVATDTAVIFKRSGGIAALNEAWTIFTDGRVETNSNTQPELSATEVEQLLSSLESSGFFELEESYLPEDTCCDRYFYEITAVQNSTYHTVRTLEATPDMPEALQQSLRLIQTLLLEDSNQ
ncbi:MAG: hypothetical protein CL608_03345 [Anaerolineaceae bacterium]|nr:hypothetical protein [Anaerolineaceae bacterium]